MIQIFQTSNFKNKLKKLHINQKKELDKAIFEVINNPLLGTAKKEDLARIRVYKFRMLNQTSLLAYRYDENDNKIILLALGNHENFYQDLK